MEASNLVQAGSIILARAGHALVDVEFASSPYVALKTLTVEWAFSVQTLPSMLTWVWTYRKTIKRLQANTSSMIKLTEAAMAGCDMNLIEYLSISFIPAIHAWM